MNASDRITLKAELRRFKSNESREDLAVLVDNPDAIRVLAAWRRVRWDWRKPKSKPPASENAAWSWLWRGGKYDLEALAASVAMPQLHVELLLAILANARVAYPDGSISEHAQQLIEAHTNQRYPVRRIGRPKGSKNKE